MANHTESPSTRFRTEDTPDGLRVIIPVRRSGFVLVFFTVWLGVWIPGGWRAIDPVLQGDHGSGDVVFVLWLVIWSVAILLAVASLLWQLAGREVLTVSRTTLTYQATSLGVGRTKTFALADIQRLRVATRDFSLASTRQHARYLPPWATNYGTLAFTCGTRTVRVAPSLDEADAGLLLQLLKSRLKAQ